MYIAASAAAISASASRASAAIACCHSLLMTGDPGYLWNLMVESFSDSLSVL